MTVSRKFPPYPRIRKDRGLPVGCGSFWYKVWKEEYHDLGGVLGYRSWLEEMIRLDREYRAAHRKPRKK
jgi:hypothetical protein